MTPQGLRPSRTRKVLFASIPSVVALVLLAGGAEWWLRRTPFLVTTAALAGGPMDPGEPPREQSCYRLSPTRAYEPIPGTCGRDAEGMYTTAPVGDSQALRLLVLGDSIAAQRIWVDSLERKVKERVGDAPVEFRNAGVEGYDTCTERTVLEEIGPRLRPHAVLVAFCVNDFQVSTVLLPGAPGRVHVRCGAGSRDVPAWLARSRLYLWSLAMRCDQDGAAPAAEAPTGPQAVARCMAGIRDAAARIGASPLVAVFPVLADAHGDVSGGGARHSPDEERTALDILVRLGIPHIAVRDVLQSVPGSMEQWRTTPEDRLHPSVAAQEVVAEGLADPVAGLLASARERR